MSRQEGKLPQYAPDLSRYCTTCGVLIHLQAVRKAKNCAAGHPVDVRRNGEQDVVLRCKVCDNFVLCKFFYCLIMRIKLHRVIKYEAFALFPLFSAHHVYCSTCRHENENRDPQKKERLRKALVQQHNVKIASLLRGISVRFGITIHVNGKGVWTMGVVKDQVPSPMLALLPSTVYAGAPNSVQSHTSLSSGSASSSASSSPIITISSQESTASSVEKLRACSISSPIGSPIGGEFVAVGAITSSASTQSSSSQKRTFSPTDSAVSHHSVVIEVSNLV